MNKIFEKYNLQVPNSILSKLTVNLQDADENTIVFYKLGSTNASMIRFFSYLGDQRPGFIIFNREPSDNVECSYGVVEDFGPIQRELCDYFYPKSNDVKVIGVTGTNGKSTVVHLCQKILNSVGHKAFSIGTIGVYSGEEEIAKGVGTTTPAYIDLRRILHEHSNYSYACIELSSHALVQKRIADFKVDAIGWTSFSQDHLDYHNSMDEYFDAKLLVEKVSDAKLIISYGEFDLERELKKRKKEFDICTEVNYEEDDSFRLAYNKKNLSLAKALCEKVLGVKVELKKGLTLPKGRYNTFRFNKSVFVVDYAHTPDALKNVLKETSSAFADYKIISIFGCGGDRDRTKRPKMLDACLEYSDEIIITTDNPRSEKPEKIIDDIIAQRSFDNEKVKIIISRSDAISKAIKNYAMETIVIIAGKGHEEYQEVNGVKHYFSDIEEVRKGIEGLDREA